VHVTHHNVDYGLWIMDYGLWIMDYGFTIYVFFHEHTPFALGIDTYLRPSLPIRFIPQHSFAG
jgi:hypothetical protein